MGRLIFHVDVNSAFLSWEAAYRLHHMGGQLDLRSIPSAVSGDMAARHGIILAKSVPAKKYGVKTGETIGEARRKCPSLYMVPPNYGLYQRCSAAFVTVLRTYSPAVEQYSIDECFVDMSGIEAAERDPVRAADELRERIRRELGFTVNVGISDNKLLAKMASDFRKPDRTCRRRCGRCRFRTCSMWAMPRRGSWQGSVSVRSAIWRMRTRICCGRRWGSRAS